MSKTYATTKNNHATRTEEVINGVRFGRTDTIRRWGPWSVFYIDGKIVGAAKWSGERERALRAAAAAEHDTLAASLREAVLPPIEQVTGADRAAPAKPQHPTLFLMTGGDAIHPDTAEEVEVLRARALKGEGVLEETVLEEQDQRGNRVVIERRTSIGGVQENVFLNGQPAKRVEIEFLARCGCEPVVADDMARYDSAVVIGTTTDDRCHEGRLRSVTMVMPLRMEPTMARWTSFVVGARIVEPITLVEKVGAVTGRREVLEATEQTIANIAAHNGEMTPQEVRTALTKGQTVCTTFAVYRRADHTLPAEEMLRRCRGGVTLADRENAQAAKRIAAQRQVERVAQARRDIEALEAVRERVIARLETRSPAPNDALRGVLYNASYSLALAIKALDGERDLIVKGG